MLRGFLMLLNMTGAPRLVVRLLMDRRVPLRLKLVLPLAIVYILSPINMITNLFGLVGRIDDVLVLVLALAIFLGAAPREVVQEHLRAGRTASGSGGRDDGRSRDGRDAIDTSYRVVDDPESSSK